MEISYYELTVPIFSKNLINLKANFQKGWKEAQEAGMSEADYLDQKLAPDMFPLLKQIQIATDNAKGVVARLTGAEMMKLEDTETTVEALLARIDTVVEHLGTYTKEQFSGAAERKIILGFMPDQYQLGKDYLSDFAIPNFFFHCTVAYAIIRAQGVGLGKKDFIGELHLHPVE